jgi:hypothetical protein
MFKLSFLSLVDINSLEINLDLINQGRAYPKFNQITIKLYHRLCTVKRKPKTK